MTDILKILFFMAIFLGGLYFYTQYTNPKMFTGFKEGLSTMNGELRCPNLLIQKGSKFFLYNSNIAEVPGVNPIQFNNLEEYVEFLEWQRAAGIRCPVLYLQNTYDAQGNRVYKVRPSVTELQGGLPPTVPVPLPMKLVDASRSDGPYNKNGYPAFDQTSFYVGTTTPLDAMNNQQESLLFSDNAMDSNWGGGDYTQALVDKGYYKGNEVQIAIPP